MATLLHYLGNCFWLIVPVLVLNAVWARKLPAIYQPEGFSHNIPAWLTVTENIFRMAVLLLPLLMPIGTGRAERTGLIIYACGFVLYSLSWILQIALPESSWSTSRAGFMAPAYTPAIWLTGIALTGNCFFLPSSYSAPIFLALSAGFLAFHNLHAWRVYSNFRIADEVAVMR